MSAEPTVKSFWRKLCKGWDDPVSYDTAVNYHSRRDPSTKYLARVCEVFEAREAYLLSGEEPATEWQERSEEEMGEARDDWERRRMEEFWSDFPQLHRRLPVHTYHQFLGVWSAHSGEGWYHSQVREYLDLEKGRLLAQLLLAPFEGREPHVVSDEFAEYATSMLQALKLALRVPDDPRAAAAEA